MSRTDRPAGQHEAAEREQDKADDEVGDRDCSQHTNNRYDDHDFYDGEAPAIELFDWALSGSLHCLLLFSIC